MPNDPMTQSTQLQSFPVRPRHTSIVLPVLGLLLSACNSAISPGYRIEKHDVEVRFVPTPGQSLHLRAAYRLKNIGNSPLDSLDAKLPSESSFSRRNLLISLDGQPISPTFSADTARIPFNPPWPVKSTRTLVIEYDLAPPNQFTENAFYLPPDNWYPALLPPNHLLARADPPEQWDLRIRVPDGFLVHASGRPRGSSRSGSERVHRFTQRPTDDFRPFLLSGRYHEQLVRSHGIAVNFWSFQSLPADKFVPAGSRLSSTAAVFQDLFGPATKTLWIVEMTPLPSPSGRGSVVSPFPAGVLLPSPFFKESLRQPVSLELAEALLAHTWLSELSVSNLGPYHFVESSLIYHAVWLARQRRGEPLDPQSLAVQNLRDSRKPPLFALALREKCGEESLNRGLRRMIQARRGLDWSIDDLRSALELESGQNLAEFFRVWLYQPGIPDDFRRRYSSPSP